LLLAWLCAAPAARADGAIAVIAHAELEELEELTLPLLRQLYLGRRTRLEGRRIHWFELPPGSATHRSFVRLALAHSERDLERYWLEQALSGGPLPPREVGSAGELLRRVATRPGALSYLEWETLRTLPQTGVKVIPLRVGERRLLPDDPGYPLRDRGKPAPGTER
jgi:ABC-type phosphate transport system substrate-binding protein